jgi:hypothetical protein
MDNCLGSEGYEKQPLRAIASNRYWGNMEARGESVKANIV